jgi:transmembrane sensor
MSDRDRIVDEAAAWHAASAGDAMDWDGFTRWLEADPRHRAAYDEVALADTLVAEHRQALRTAEPDMPVPSRRYRWMGWAGGAIAAALALLLIVPTMLASNKVTYATAAASREIALSDGSSVTLAPHSRLVVDGRQLALTGGAWFDVHHDPQRALTVSAGPLELRDIGTKFDVQADPGLVRVGVAEGQIEVTAQTLAAPVEMKAGRHMLFDARAGRATLTDRPAAEIGTWRSGHLTYDSAPLSLVVADLSRYAGIRIELPASLKDRRFSGTLASSDGHAAIRDLAQLMGLGLVRTADGGYRLEPRTN